MRNRSRKVLNRLSLRSVLTSKKQNLITIFAIMLTTILFTSLFTVFFSLDRTIDLQNKKDVGYRSDACVYYVDDDLYESIENNKRVKDVCKGLFLGYGEIGDTVFVVNGDEDFAKTCFCYPKEGTLPQNKNDVVISKTLLDTLDVPKKIGTKIELEYGVADPDGVIEVIKDEFTICGFSDNASKMILVSDDYANDIMSTYKLDKASQTEAFINFRSSAKVVEQTEIFREQLGLEEGRMMANGVYLADTGTIDDEGVVTIVVFIMLIVVTGFLIIYNIFQITVAGKIRNYGLLKTVGVTSKQLRKIIMGEAFILCLIAVPLGLVSGYFVGNSLIPTILQNTTYGKDLEIISGFNIFVFLGAAAFSVFTVWISSLIPVRKASKVSPIEALRYSDVRVSEKKHSSNRAKIPAMALSNLGRNKKRTGMVLLSLALALVVFNSLCALMGNVDVNQYVHAAAPDMDFTVGTTEYFQGDVNTSLSDREIETIKSHIDTEHCGCSYMAKNTIVDIEGRSELALLTGVDEELLSEFDIFEGNVDDMRDPECNGIIMENCDAYKIGDKITLSYVTRYGVEDPKTGEVYYLDEVKAGELPEDITGFKPHNESHTKEFTVCAIFNEHPSSFRPQFTFGEESFEMYVTRSELEELTGGDIVTLCFCADVVSDEAASEAEAYLSSLTSESDRLKYTSIETAREEFRTFTDSIMKVGTVLVGIIGLIGILNFINAFLTSILSRKREMALLKAVGMTSSQQRKMLFTEGLFYSLFTILLAAPLSIVMNKLIGNLGMYWLSEHVRIVLWPLLIILPIFVLLSYIVPTLMYGRIKGKSIVDDLRVNE